MINYLLRNSISLIATISAICIISCEKSESISTERESTIPVYTEIGANTMSYRVNGKLVKVFDYTRNFAGVYGSVGDFTSQGKKIALTVNGNLVKSDHFESIELYVEDFKGIGYYTTNTNVPKNLISQFMYSIGENEILSDGYTTDATHHGYVQVTKFDTLNQIISGRFEFTGFLFFWGEEKDTVRITDGMFDFRYRKF